MAGWLRAGASLFLFGMLFGFLGGRGSGVRAEADVELRYAGGTTGYDISWPQCGGPYPQTPFDFGIVGVTGGKSFSTNPCLADEWSWAQGGDAPAAVYMNLNAPPRNSPRGLSGPYGDCSRRDLVCQHRNYGHNAAVYAVAQARLLGVESATWWIDIETINTWSKNRAHNAETIRAAIAYLQGQGFRVGLYSTPYQWGVIAGSYSPGLPNWTAGAEDEADASSRCTPQYAFGGGAVELVQSVDVYDRNYACP